MKGRKAINPLQLSNRQLVDAARKAMANSMALSSGFKVGAAVLTDGGKVFTGCNIENPSLMLTLCAERVALYNAISNGERGFKKMAVFATRNPCYPCGSCRQALLEFAPGCEVIVVDEKGKTKKARIEELLPYGVYYQM